MTLKIGRAVLDCPARTSWSGDSLTLSFNIGPSLPLVEAKALRQQILGMDNNPDEPVVPVTWTVDTDLNGFYRVRGATVEPTANYLTDGFMRAQVQLERLGGGYAKAVHDMTFVAVVRSNPFGITELTPTPALWFMSIGSMPGDDAVISNDAPAWIGTVRQGPEGPYTPLDASGSTGTGSVSFSAIASEAYGGACLLEVDYSGSGQWFPVIGRQIPVGSTRWRLSNSLIRVTLSAGTMAVEYWNGSAWAASRSVKTASDSGAARYIGLSDPANSSSAAVQPAVLKNSPDAIVLTLPQSSASATGQLRASFTRFSIQRSTTFVAVDIDAESSSIQQRRLQLATPAAVSSLNASTFSNGSGVAAFYTGTTAGHLWVASGEDSTGGTITVDTTNGRITTSATPNGARWRVGVFPSSATAANTVRDAFAAVTTRTMVVSV